MAAVGIEVISIRNEEIAITMDDTDRERMDGNTMTNVIPRNSGWSWQEQNPANKHLNLGGDCTPVPADGSSVAFWDLPKQTTQLTRGAQ